MHSADFEKKEKGKKKPQRPSPTRPNLDLDPSKTFCIFLFYFMLALVFEAGQTGTLSARLHAP